MIKKFLIILNFLWAPFYMRKTRKDLNLFLFSKFTMRSLFQNIITPNRATTEAVNRIVPTVTKIMQESKNVEKAASVSTDIVNKVEKDNTGQEYWATKAEKNQADKSLVKSAQQTKEIAEEYKSDAFMGKYIAQGHSNVAHKTIVDYLSDSSKATAQTKTKGIINSLEKKETRFEENYPVSGSFPGNNSKTPTTGVAQDIDKISVKSDIVKEYTLGMSSHPLTKSDGTVKTELYSPKANKEINEIREVKNATKEMLNLQKPDTGKENSVDMDFVQTAFHLTIQKTDPWTPTPESKFKDPDDNSDI